MSKKVASLYAEISADSSKLEKALKETKTGLSSAKTDLIKATASFKEFNQVISAGGPDFRNLKSELQNYIGQLKSVTPANQAYANSIAYIVRAYQDGRISADEARVSLERIEKQMNKGVETNKKMPLTLADIKLAWLAVAGAVTGAIGVMKTIGNEMKKLITDYSDYATQVEKFARATGITGEEASRLIQTADDFQVSAEQMGTALKWALQNGFVPTIENIAKLSDEYKSIQDPAKRAAEMQKIFGRSWIDLIPLLDQGGDKIRANAATIGDGLIVTDKAIKKNIEFKRTLDDLDDSWTSLKMTLGGGVLPILLSYLKAINKFGDANEEANKQLGPFISANKTLVLLYSLGLVRIQELNAEHQEEQRLLRMMPDAYLNTANAITTMGEDAEEATPKTKGLGDAIEEGFSGVAGIIADARAEIEKTAEGLRTGMVDAIQGVRDAEASWQEGAGGDVVQALKDQKVAGDKLSEAYKIIDDVMGTGLVEQEKYNTAVDTLAKNYAQGKISGEEFKTGLQDLKEGFMPFSEEVQKANDKLWFMRLQMDWLQNHNEVNLKVTYTEEGPVPGANAAPPGGPSGPVSTPSTPQKYQGPVKKDAGGGSYTVPAGFFENYSVGGNHYASSGETVTVTPKGAAAGINFNAPVTIVANNPTEFMAQLGRMARQKSRAGAASIGA